MEQLFRKVGRGYVSKYFEIMDVKSAKARGWVIEPTIEKIEPIVEMPVVKKVKTKKPKVKHDNKN